MEREKRERGRNGSHPFRERDGEAIERFRAPLKQVSRGFKNRPVYIGEEDLVQEMLCHLCEKRAQGELQDKPDSYILRSCWFYGKNYLRKVQETGISRSLDEPVDGQGTLLKEVISDGCLSSANHEKEMASLYRLMEETLSDREKEVIQHTLQGLTTREVGKILGISHVMVVKLYRGICRKCREVHEKK